MTVRMMIRAMLVLAATAMILVALTACGGGSAQEESNKPRPLPEEDIAGTNLADEPYSAPRPGEYRSEEFQPSFSFKVGKGWRHFPPETSDILLLARGEFTGLAFTNVQQVYKPGTPGQWVEAPKDMVGWFQHHPYLQTSKPEPISVGGVKGVQFDVVVEGLPKDYYGVCGSDCVDLFRTSSNHEHALWSSTDEHSGGKQRVIVLEGVQGKTVTIYYSSPATDFDEFALEAQRVIDSVKWRETA